jgi:hypothetical protein
MLQDATTSCGGRLSASLHALILMPRCNATCVDSHGSMRRNLDAECCVYDSHSILVLCKK